MNTYSAIEHRPHHVSGQMIQGKSMSAAEFCLLASVAAYVVTNILGSININSIAGIGKGSISFALQMLGLALVALGYLIGGMQHRPSALLLVALVVGACSYYVAQTPIMLWLFLLAGLGRSSSLKNVATVVCVTSGLMLAIVLIANRMGIIPSVILGGERARDSLGFAHPNNLGLTVLVFIMSLNTAISGKHMGRLLALITVASAFLMVTSNTRTVALMLPIYWILLLLFEKEKSLCEHRRGIVLWIFWGCTVISVGAVLWYKTGSPVALRLDQLLTGRLYYPSFYLDRYFPTLFGIDTTEAALPLAQGGGYYIDKFMLDNSYIRLLIQFGLLSTGIFYVYVTMGIRRMPNDPLLIAGIITIFLYALSENCMYSPMTDFFLISLLGEVFGGVRHGQVGEK